MAVWVAFVFSASFQCLLIIYINYDNFRRLSPKITGGLIKMRSDTFKDSIVPAKYKILSALAIVVATKCDPCIIGNTKMVYEAGKKFEAEEICCHDGIPI
jgi:hypothetical protein